LCRQEAAALTSLQHLYTRAGVNFSAVLHEDPGPAMVEEFAGYFGGPIYLDGERRFFGPHERRLGLMGMLRVSTYTRAMQAKDEGVIGNYAGDGTLLGGVYVIGPGDAGILFEHQEQDFGDHSDKEELAKALLKIEHLS